MSLRLLIRQIIMREWHEHLDNVMAPGQGIEGEEDDQEDFWDKKRDHMNKNPMDPYDQSKPKPIATNRALSHSPRGFGSGPGGGRTPGGTKQGTSSGM